MIEEKIKKEIHQVAAGIFKQFGYRKVNMADFSDALRISRPSLYKHFQNKQDILNLFILDECDKILIASQSEINNTKSFYDNVVKFNQIKLGQIKAFTEEYHLVLNEMKENYMFLYHLKDILKQEEMEVYRKIILWSIQNSEIKPIEEERITFLTDTIVSTFRSMEISVLINGKLDDNFFMKINWIAEVFQKGLI